MFNNYPDRSLAELGLDYSSYQYKRVEVGAVGMSIEYCASRNFKYYLADVIVFYDMDTDNNNLFYRLTRIINQDKLNLLFDVFDKLDTKDQLDGKTTVRLVRNILESDKV